MRRPLPKKPARRFIFGFVKKEIQLAGRGIRIQLPVPSLLFPGVEPLPDAPIVLLGQTVDGSLDFLYPAHAWSLSSSEGAGCAGLKLSDGTIRNRAPYTGKDQGVNIMTDGIMNFPGDLKYALRSLAHSKGLALTVILTLALGIGANAAIFTLVRGVLLRPLANRDEDRLIYIRQSAHGIGVDDAAFSVPEINDMRSGVKTLNAFGDFSAIGFTMVGLGEPREIRAGVVGGSYFDVMGLHPVLGRLLDMRDDGPEAAGAIVLTYRFWSGSLKSDPSVIGKTVRLEAFGPPRSATIVGVLEPSVPYPAETEIIANIVTSPHHLSATMVTGRVHRMTELFGRLAPGATLEQARAELRTAHAAMVEDHPEAYPAERGFSDRRRPAARSDHLARANCAAGAAGGIGTRVHHRVFERSQPDSGANRASRRRTGDPCGIGRDYICAAPGVAGRKSAIVRRRSGRWGIERGADGLHPVTLCFAVFGPRTRPDRGFQHAVGGCGAGDYGRDTFGVRSAASIGGFIARLQSGQAARASLAAPTGGCGCSP